MAKFEYLKDGFADIEYVEASQRYRHKINYLPYKWSLVLILAACMDPGSIPGISTKNTRYGDDWI